jgi:serine/threonine protein kinase
MSPDDSDLETRLAEVVLYHQRHGVLPPLDGIVADRPDLAGPLRALAERYLRLSSGLDVGLVGGAETDPAEPPRAWPSIEGFRTVERLGAGGMGEVYKLQDLTLDRFVAAKIIRRDRGPRIAAGLDTFLREARSLALFSDSRIVQIFECRLEADPAVILMEYVDGFELGRVGPSLEFRQRARIMQDICDAIERAHALGIQHRDLKPSNIMLDAALSPKILDFGLSDGDPQRGHLRGTPYYFAPEQLDPTQPIDARTDVYAMGVILYELLCGAVPYDGPDTADLLAAVRTAQPRLPVEIDPRVPEALQAVALKAMERRPEDRYQSARGMGQDLDRYLEGRPVVARPTQYATTLGTRVRPHLDQIGEWLRLRLIYPHEAARLASAYVALDRREDDWILAARSLSYSQIALYLGAFFLFAGSLFYFVAHRVYQTASGMAGPIVVLGLPFAGLNLAGRALYRREHRAVGVAFYLAGVSLLPLFLLIWFQETNIWMAPDGSINQFFTDGWISNRQLQATVLVACAWAGWLALRTKTGALSTVSTILVFLLALAVLADLGLRDWLENGDFDRLSLRLWPLVPVYGAAAYAFERRGRSWFAGPGFVASAIVLVLVLDLLAFNGRMFHYLGISMAPLQPAAVEDPTLLPTLAALTLNGMAFYVVALLIERVGSAAMEPATQLLVTIAPFSMLEPLAYLSETAAYSQRFDWMYLTLAVGIAIASHQRQRRSFYYAGLVNAGFALYLIALHHEWFERAWWGTALVVTGLVALALGLLLDARQRRAR